VAARSDHFDGQRFFNPTGPALQPFAAVPRMLLTRRARWPSFVPVVARQPPARHTASVVVTFIGHATFLIQTAAGNIMTDPMYSKHAGPWNRLGPRRVRPPAIALDALPPISIVLLSHNHYDHCDLPTLGMLAKHFDPLVITPLGNGRLARAAGIRRVEELDWWESAQSASVPITLTPAHHFRARPVRSQLRTLGRIHADGRSRAFLLRGRHGVRAVLPRYSTAPGPIDLALP
jgi:hypothetical protein